MKNIKLVFLVLISIFFASYTQAQTKEETKSWIQNTGVSLIKKYQFKGECFSHSSVNTYSSLASITFEDIGINIRTYGEDIHKRDEKLERTLYCTYYGKFKNIKKVELHKNTCDDCYLEIRANPFTSKVEIWEIDRGTQVKDWHPWILIYSNDREALKRLQKAIIHLARLYGSEIAEPVDENTF